MSCEPSYTLFTEQGSCDPPSLAATGGGVFHAFLPFSRDAANNMVKAGAHDPATDLPWAATVGDFVAEMGTYNPTTGVFTPLAGVAAVNAVQPDGVSGLYAQLTVPAATIVGSQTVYYFVRFRPVAAIGAALPANINHGLTTAIRIT